MKHCTLAATVAVVALIMLPPSVVAQTLPSPGVQPLVGAGSIEVTNTFLDISGLFGIDVPAMTIRNRIVRNQTGRRSFGIDSEVAMSLDDIGQPFRYILGGGYTWKLDSLKQSSLTIRSEIVYNELNERRSFITFPMIIYSWKPKRTSNDVPSRHSFVIGGWTFVSSERGDRKQDGLVWLTSWSYALPVLRDRGSCTILVAATGAFLPGVVDVVGVNGTVLYSDTPSRLYLKTIVGSAVYLDPGQPQPIWSVVVGRRL